MLDYIIVGLGLSGACAAFRMQKQGYDFLVFDDGELNSSKVAAGVMNPIILNKFTLAWRANEQLDLALEFYADMERYLDKSFLSPIEIYRKFASIEEQNNWFSAADKPLLAPFMDTNLRCSVGENISGEFKFGKLDGTARVDTRVMLGSLEEKLLSLGSFRKEPFNYDYLNLIEGGLEYRGVKAKGIVFCEGFGLRKNPYFNTLPLVGNKGEYIIIKAPDLELSVVVKASVFISPLGDGLYAVGATYNNQDKTPGPTKQARAELEQKLKGIIEVPYEVVNQVAGIRPTSGDRRPIIGQHPKYPHFYTCNGFGSRGVLTAPMASKQLLEYMQNGAPISPEMDLVRFKKRLLKS